jgi:hypothetical protein
MPNINSISWSSCRLSTPLIPLSLPQFRPSHLDSCIINTLNWCPCLGSCTSLQDWWIPKEQVEACHLLAGNVQWLSTDAFQSPQPGHLRPAWLRPSGSSNLTFDTISCTPATEHIHSRFSELLQVSKLCQLSLSLCKTTTSSPVVCFVPRPPNLLAWLFPSQL